MVEVFDLLGDLEVLSEESSQASHDGEQLLNLHVLLLSLQSHQPRHEVSFVEEERGDGVPLVGNQGCLFVAELPLVHRVDFPALHQVVNSLHVLLEVVGSGSHVDGQGSASHLQLLVQPRGVLQQPVECLGLVLLRHYQRRYEIGTSEQGLALLQLLDLLDEVLDEDPLVVLGLVVVESQEHGLVQFLGLELVAQGVRVDALLQRKGLAKVHKHIPVFL